MTTQVDTSAQSEDLLEQFFGAPLDTVPAPSPASKTSDVVGIATKGFFAAALPFVKKYGWAAASKFGTFAMGNKFGIAASLVALGLAYNQWKQGTDLDALETQELRKRFIEQRNRKYKKIMDNQAPPELPTTEMMETIGTKKNIRNAVVFLHCLSVAATLILGTLACFGIVHMSVPYLFSAAGYLFLNTFLSISLAKHFRMSEFTKEPNRNLEINKGKNLNKPKYRSNTNNTLRYIATFVIPFPFLPLVVKAVTFADKVEKESKQLAAIALNN